MIHLQISIVRSAFELNLDIQLPVQGITAIFGPSGSGKTSLLRAVAGLEKNPLGRIQIGANIWQDTQQGICLPTWQRALGYVFQESSLLPHLSVAENLNFGLKRALKLSNSVQSEANNALQASIELLGIGSLLQRMPDELSGGERQRVAIARAIAMQPQLLLMDEPLASLDAARRQEIFPWLARLRDELKMPMLYVTHSAEEVTRLADHLVVLDRGQVKAQGPVNQVLTQVVNPVVMGEDAGVLTLRAVLFGCAMQVSQLVRRCAFASWHATSAWQLLNLKTPAFKTNFAQAFKASRQTRIHPK
jgi:molybdate transport system ATP-binding protein